MQFKQAQEILAGFHPSLSDGHNVFGGVLTSLFTISPTFPIRRSERLEFRRKGKAFKVSPVIGPSFDVSLDSDFYAKKGALFTSIDCGEEKVLDVCSTHLMFGGGFGPAAQAIINALTPFGAHISESNKDERFATELEQLDELLAFYSHFHDPSHVGIICGDFNIDGSDPSRFAQIHKRMSAFLMHDAWAAGPFGNERRGGQTARNDDGEGAPRQADFDAVCVPLNGDRTDLFCDDTKRTVSGNEFAGRFDYIFVELPSAQHRCTVDVARVRRRGFRRSHPTDKQAFLSDHLGLETTLYVAPRPN